MFNSGTRGARARDGQGTTSPQTQFVQNASPQPSILSYAVQGADDLALATAGGQTVVLTGTGFAPGISVVLDGATISPVTRISDTQLSFTSPAKSGGSYTIIVYNPTGGGAFLVPGLIYSAVPAWTTNAGSIGADYETRSVSRQVVASSDSTLTYTLSSGSLPSGVTLNSNGTITGTSPVDGSSTTYTFAVTATDQELQDTTRTFTLTINTDVVTWNNPLPAAAVNLDSVAADITLAATSAAGYTIASYSADSLPAGLTLANGAITGTPTLPGTFTTTLSATAATTGRTGTNTITWTITLGDALFNSTVLLLPGTIVTSLSDMSTYNHQLSIAGGAEIVKDSPFSNLEGGSYFAPSYNQWVDVPGGTTAFQFGTGDYTIECWVKFPTYRRTGSSLFDFGPDGTNAPKMKFSTGNLIYYFDNSNRYIAPASTFYTDAGAYNDGGWHHFAMTRASGSAKVFIDGVQFGSTFSDYWNYSGTYALRIFGQQSANETMYGQCSNFRVVKGTALYTTNFTKPTQALTAIEGTTLLALQTTVPTNNNSIIDFGPARRGLTRNGNVTQGSFAPFGENWGTYFDGSGNYLTCASNATFSFGTGDFTVEAWININQASGAFDRGIWTNGPTSAGSFGFGAVSGTTGKLSMAFYGGPSLTGSTTLAGGQWYHVAVTRSGTTVRLFVNGVVDGTMTSSFNNTSSGCVVGRSWTNFTTADMLGYISNLRVVKGTALYTGNFTPSTAPLTAVTGTSLLTCQDPYIVDESPNGFTITPTSGVRVQAMSPFSKTKLERTGNYSLRCRNGLVLTDYNNAFNLPGDFTIECWIYVLSYGGMIMVYAGGNNIAWASYELVCNSDGINFAGSSANNGYDIGSEGGSTGRMGTVQLNTWNHIAVTRSGNTYRGFVNGVQGMTLNTSLTPYTQSTRGLWLGGNYDSPYAGSNTMSNYNGYISNFRIVKGTALYTGNFTPPTSPLTAVSGTSILTCQSDRLRDNSANNFRVYLPDPFNTRMTTTEFSPFTSTLTYTDKQDYTPNTFGGSLYFDGTGDYLGIADSMNVGGGDFTLQCWIYPVAWVEWQSVFSTRATNGASASQWCLGVNQTGYPYVYSDSFQVQGSAGQVPLNQWTHLAVTRKDGAWMRLFVNGSQVDANQGGAYGTFSDGAAAIGANRNGTEPFNGYISDLQFTNGTSLYNGPFIPPRAPVSPTGTTLLVNGMNGGIRDGSAKTVLETVGDVRISTSVGKFNRTYSMFFDGTGDAIKTAPSIDLAMGSRDFTLDFWHRPTTLAVGNQIIITNQASSFGSTEWGLFAPITTVSGYTNKYAFFVGSNSTSVPLLVSTSTIVTNAWTYVSITRSGSTWRLFVNGTIEATATYTGALDNGASAPLFIGYTPAGQNVVGYLQDLRLTKGRARYTANFTPPLSVLPQK